MNIAVFYPCHPYYTESCTTNRTTLEKQYPVLNYPPCNPPLNKHDEFLQLLKAPSIDSLMVWRGGRIEDDGSLWKTSLALLKSLSEDDWMEIKKSNKNIIGYSDATYLLSALVSHDIICFYGPNYNSTLQCSTEQELTITLDYLTQALESKTDYTINFNEEKLTSGQYFPWTFNEGIATGRLIGGNLDTIYTLLKMHEYKSHFSLRQGDILLLEENDTNYTFKNGTTTGGTYDKLSYLNDVGVFSKIGGLILGRSKTALVFDAEKEYYFTPVKNQNEKEYLEKCICNILPSNIPILANVACSHTHPMVTLPLGRKITLNSRNKTLTVHFNTHLK